MAGSLQDKKYKHKILENSPVRLKVVGEAVSSSRSECRRHVLKASQNVFPGCHMFSSPARIHSVKPILAITEGFIEPCRVLIAFDGGMVTRRGVEMVAASPLFRGLPVYLLMSGKESQEGPRQLEWAKTTLEASGFEVFASLIPGDAERVIAKAICEQGIDMLIMGAYSHSPLRSLLLGSKTADLLRSAKIPTLLLR
jgi:nucleotide-binding universal stress UspA family protein